MIRGRVEMMKERDEWLPLKRSNGFSKAQIIIRDFAIKGWPQDFLTVSDKKADIERGREKERDEDDKKEKEDQKRKWEKEQLPNGLLPLFPWPLTPWIYNSIKMSRHFSYYYYLISIIRF